MSLSYAARRGITRAKLRRRMAKPPETEKPVPWPVMVRFAKERDRVLRGSK